MNIFDAIKPEEIAVYYKESAGDRIPYLGQTLFPPKQQLGLDLSWIKGSGGLPVALKPSAFDSETRLRDRVGFEQISTSMPYFKEGYLLKEVDRQNLNTAQASGSKQMADMILSKIFDDTSELIRGADVQAERMQMQLLSKGRIDIKANKLAYEYDYMMNEDNKEQLTGTDKWSDLANSNPIEDIERWINTIEEETGERPARAICTSKTYNYLRKNKNILEAIGGTMVTNAKVDEFISDMLGVSIQVYNKKFKTEAGTTEQFFPDDVFTLIPDGNLGNLYYGTTPEQSDLMSGSVDAEVSIVNTGVAITTQKRIDPVNVFTKASAIMLPSFEQIDSVFIGSVA